MHCVLCGETLVPRLVSTDASFAGQTYQIPDVPAEVCLGCGEPYFELAVVDDLEDEARTQWVRARTTG